MMSNTLDTITGARPNEGSSSKSSLGLAIRPRATATICCCPPDRVQPSASAKGRMSENKSNMASASRAMSDLLTPLLLEAPSMIFSREVRPGKTRRPSGTWAMPKRTICSGPNPASDRPSNKMSPDAGLVSPDMARKVVDFPAPLAPSSVTTSPASTDSEMPRKASISP